MGIDREHGSQAFLPGSGPCGHPPPLHLVRGFWKDSGLAWGGVGWGAGNRLQPWEGPSAQLFTMPGQPSAPGRTCVTQELPFSALPGSPFSQTVASLS